MHTRSTLIAPRAARPLTRAIATLVASLIAMTLVLAPGQGEARAWHRPLIMSPDGLGIELDLTLGGGQDSLGQGDRTRGLALVAAQARYRVARRWSR